MCFEKNHSWKCWSSTIKCIVMFRIKCECLINMKCISYHVCVIVIKDLNKSFKSRKNARYSNYNCRYFISITAYLQFLPYARWPVIIKLLKHFDHLIDHYTGKRKWVDLVVFRLCFWLTENTLFFTRNFNYQSISVLNFFHSLKCLNHTWKTK